MRWLMALLVLMLAPVVLAFGLGEADSDTVEWPLTEFAEPSGIVYHPIRKTLFLVGDEGDIGELTLDGKLLRQFHLGGDLEAITVDPRNGLLYLAREGHEILFEVRPTDFKLLRRFTVDRSFEGDPDFLRRGGDGIEGLTFVVDENDPEGGRLWAVNQYDPPTLIELAISLRSSKDKFSAAKIDRTIPVDSAPLSEVTWDPQSNRFLIVSALWRRVVLLDAKGTQTGTVHIPGFMPEGITRIPGGRFAIAQDSGGVVLWTPKKEPFGNATVEAPHGAQDKAEPAPAANEKGAVGEKPDAPRPAAGSPERR